MTNDQVEFAINMESTDKLKELLASGDLTEEQAAEVKEEIHKRETYTADDILESWRNL